MDEKFDVINRIFIDRQGFARNPVEQKEYCLRHYDKIIALLPDFIEEIFLHSIGVYSTALIFRTILSALLFSTEGIVNDDRLDHIINEIRKRVPMRCPEKGEFIGYKKVFIKTTYDNGGQIKVIYGIAKLRIPETAQRSSAFGSKCRCSEAFVEEITSMDGSIKYNSAVSMRSVGMALRRCAPVTIDDSMSAKYIVGETVKPDSFDPNPWNECSNGIHFFMTREEAETYNLQ